MGKRINKVSVVDPNAHNTIEEVHYMKVKSLQETKKCEKG